MTSAVVGIDVGSNSCYLSVARKGGIETLLNEYSDRCTPSCISFGNRGRFIGNSANMQLVTNPKNTINHFIPLIGKKYSDSVLQMELPYLNYKIIENKNTISMEVQYLGKSLQFKPEQLMAMLITKLKTLAEQELAIPLTQAVVNVPSYYTITERRSVLAALTIAGVACMRIINDLTAVGLLYHITRFQSLTQSKVVAFVDVGYTNFQASIVRFSKERFQVVSSVCEVNLGGREFDRVIYNHLARSFKDKYSLDVLDSAKAGLRVMAEAERVKKRLSANAAEFVVNIECLMNNQDVSAKIDRTLFESLSESLTRRMAVVLVDLLEDFKKASSGAGNGPLELISCVELVGGSSRVPAVKQVVTDCFRLEPQITLNADEAVSRGCAIQSALLNTNCVIKQVEFYDCTPYGICLDTYSIIPSGAGANGSGGGSRQRLQTVEVAIMGQAYPFTGTVELDECSMVEIRYTDRNAVPNDNKSIGYIHINQDPNTILPEKVCKYLLEFTYSAFGLFVINSLSLKRNSKTPRSNNPSPPTLQSGMSPLSSASQHSEAKKRGQKSQHKQPHSSANYDIYGPVDFQIQYHMNIENSDLGNMTKLELDFIRKDLEETERLDSKNRLEECMYRYRDQLSSLTETTETVQLIRHIGDLENWLCEEGEDQAKEKYTANLQKLDQMMKPFKATKAPSNVNVSNVVDQLQSYVKEAETLIRTLSLQQNPNQKQQHNNASAEHISVKEAEQKLQTFLDQSREVLGDVDRFLTDPQELSRFLKDFRLQLDRSGQIASFNGN